MLPGSLSTERFTCPKCGLGYQAIKEWFPDDVSGGRSECIVTCQKSAVPEPSTWAMLLIGFAGIGFAAYRRRLKIMARMPSRQAHCPRTLPYWKLLATMSRVLWYAPVRG
jgi:PEP-CTERM motif